jgi:hypothetical protein
MPTTLHQQQNRSSSRGCLANELQRHHIRRPMTGENSTAARPWIPGTETSIRRTSSMASSLKLFSSIATFHSSPCPAARPCSRTRCAWPLSCQALRRTGARCPCSCPPSAGRRLNLADFRLDPDNSAAPPTAARRFATHDYESTASAPGLGLLLLGCRCLHRFPTRAA